MVQTTAFSFPCSAEPCSATAQRAAQESADANRQCSTGVGSLSHANGLRPRSQDVLLRAFIALLKLPP